MPKDYKRKTKQKFSGNRYRIKPTKKARVNNANERTHSEVSTSNHELNTSACARKIGSHNILGGSKEETANMSGYRFIDLEILYEFVTEVCCKLWRVTVNMKENVSHLRARCKSCGWVYTFHTSFILLRNKKRF